MCDQPARPAEPRRFTAEEVRAGEQALAYYRTHPAAVEQAIAENAQLSAEGHAEWRAVQERRAYAEHPLPAPDEEWVLRPSVGGDA
jgi:hypothetical protein